VSVRALRIPDSRLAPRTPIGAPELSFDDLNAISRGFAFGDVRVTRRAKVVFAGLQESILEATRGTRELVSFPLGVDNLVETLGAEEPATLATRSAGRRERIEAHRELDRTVGAFEPVEIRRAPAPQTIDSTVLEILTKGRTRKSRSAAGRESEFGLALSEAGAHRSSTWSSRTTTRAGSRIRRISIIIDSPRCHRLSVYETRITETPIGQANKDLERKIIAKCSVWNNREFPTGS
jgi:hypothetical protein